MCPYWKLCVNKITEKWNTSSRNEITQKSQGDKVRNDNIRQKLDAEPVSKRIENWIVKVVRILYSNEGKISVWETKVENNWKRGWPRKLGIKFWFILPLNGTCRYKIATFLSKKKIKQNIINNKIKTLKIIKSQRYRRKRDLTALRKRNCQEISKNGRSHYIHIFGLFYFCRICSNACFAFRYLL